MVKVEKSRFLLPTRSIVTGIMFVLLGALTLAVATVWAADPLPLRRVSDPNPNFSGIWVDTTNEDRIKVLEEKLARLKAEQMELKKEATAAAAAAPTFTYRPGQGATIEAADRSFSVNFHYLVHYFIYNSTNGEPHRGSTRMDLFLRRNRPGIIFCLNNCFYEWGIRFDLSTGIQVSEQGQWFDIHFEQMNPWFPTFTIGDRTNPVPFSYVVRSVSSSAQHELASLMLFDNGVDELSHKALALYWADRPIPWGMLPGVFTLDFEFKSGGGIQRNVVSDTDRKQFEGIFGLKPFSRSKNPWIEKIKWGIGLQIDSIDARSAAQGRRLRIMTLEKGTNSVTLLDANNIGSGLHHRIETGLEWGYGPYLIRAEGGVSKFRSGNPTATTTDGFLGIHGGYWRIGHEMFVWSPKGLLTGSASTPHSLQLGWAFERSQADCGRHLTQGCSPTTTLPGFGTTAAQKADFHRNHLTLRDLSLWYFFTPAIRLGAWWWWWDAANTPRFTQVQIGCTRNTNATLGKAGSKSCTWHTVNLGLQVSF